MSRYKVKDYMGRDQSISYTVEDIITDGVNERGIAEGALGAAVNSAETLGMLVEILVDKGVLTKEDVKNFVGYREVVENTNAT